MLFGRKKPHMDRDVYEILKEAQDYLGDSPQVEFNPRCSYDGRVMRAFATLPTDTNYMSKHDKLKGKPIEEMSMDDIAVMYTFIERGERFSDGHIAAYINDGTVLKLVNRQLELIRCDYPELSRVIEAFTYTRGGGMTDSLYRLSVTDDKLVLETRECHGHKTNSKKFKIPSDVYAAFEANVIDSGIRTLEKDLPRKEVFALDAEATSVQIICKDGTCISFNSGQEVPDGVWDAVEGAAGVLREKIINAH